MPGLDRFSGFPYNERPPRPRTVLEEFQGDWPKETETEETDENPD